jgi:hypothetical protein
MKSNENIKILEELTTINLINKEKEKDKKEVKKDKDKIWVIGWPNCVGRTEG